MTARSGDPSRWSDRGADARALERRAASLVAAAGHATPPLGQQALARIRAEALADRSAMRVRGFGMFGARGRLAVAAAMLLVTATAAGGAGVLWRRHLGARPRLQAPAAVERPTTPESPAPPLPGPRASPESEADEPPPAVAPRPKVRKHAAPARTVALADPIAPATDAQGETAPAARGADESARASDTEAHLLARAFFDLRRSHDPRRALVTLDRYQRAFPHGVLESEALNARLEAVVALGDLETALALLDAKGTFSDPLGSELLLARAELRANAGRCREALLDFTEILGRPGAAPGGRQGERALYGRAVCLGRLEQHARARADLVEYRRRFPAGRFAADVGRLLDPFPSRTTP